jgi:DNA-binding transcriptional LysR family regulator
MDFRLKVFQSVANHKSFTRASKELLISQPAISKHIQELESLYKVKLFERIGTRIAITAEGELLLSHSNRILNAFESLDYEMRQLTQSISGILRIGAETTYAQYSLPALAAAYIKRNPSTKLTIISGNSRDIEASVFNKEIDLAIISSDKEIGGMEYLPYQKDQIVAFCSSRSTLSDQQKISTIQLKQIPIVLPQLGNELLLTIETTLEINELKLQQLNIMMQLDNTESIKNFVENSDTLGFTTYRSIAPEIANGKFKVIEINSLNFNRLFQFVRMKNQKNEICTDFIRFAEKQNSR